MNNDQKPTGRIVKRYKSGSAKYALYSTGELWKTGKRTFMCGYCSSPDRIDEAVHNHEEEMESLVAVAKAEFADFF